MKPFYAFGFLYAFVGLVSAKTFYIQGPTEVKDCAFTGYVPGGNVVEVTKIKAPVAELARKATGSIMGPVSQASTLAMHSLNLVTKLSTAFSAVSPALGPALGVFGAATGILKSISEPKPADILKAANTAIADLTKDMNDKLDDMTGYVDGQIITTEKELISREYRSKFNLLIHCVNEPTKELSTECQRDTYKEISSSMPKFAVFDQELVSSSPASMTTIQVKKLEAYLVVFRNYADLLMLSLVPLVKLYKTDKSTTGQGYYRKYSLALKMKAEEFAKYSKAAVEAIVKMHKGTNGAGACSDSFECGAIHEIWEGVTWFKKHTADNDVCTCVIDDGTKKRCSVKGTVRVDGKNSYTAYAYPVSGTTEALKEWASRILENTYAKPFVSKQEKVIKAYWQAQLLSFIPNWLKAAKLAEAGTKVKDTGVPLSDEFSPRYKYRVQYARMYPNFI